LKLLRVQTREDPAKGIMRGDAVGQLQKGLQPRSFRVPELLDIHPGVRSTYDGTERDGQDCQSLMVFRPFHSRVFQSRKMFLQGDPFDLLLPLFLDVSTSL